MKLSFFAPLRILTCLKHLVKIYKLIYKYYLVISFKFDKNDSLKCTFQIDEIDFNINSYIISFDYIILFDKILIFSFASIDGKPI